MDKILQIIGTWLSRPEYYKRVADHFFLPAKFTGDLFDEMVRVGEAKNRADAITKAAIAVPYSRTTKWSDLAKWVIEVEAHENKYHLFG